MLHVVMLIVGYGIGLIALACILASLSKGFDKYVELMRKLGDD